MRNLLVAAAALLCSSQAFAVATTPTEGLEVHSVRIDRTGQGYVFFTAPLAGVASCGTTQAHMLAFDANSSAGRSIMSVALAAKAAKRKIYATGTGTCDIYTVVEDWASGSIL